MRKLNLFLLVAAGFVILFSVGLLSSSATLQARPWPTVLTILSMVCVIGGQLQAITQHNRQRQHDRQQ